MRGIGENGASATKKAKNVAGTGENEGSATKRAKNVDGAGENEGSATKTAENVDGSEDVKAGRRMVESGFLFATNENNCYICTLIRI